MWKIGAHDVLVEEAPVTIRTDWEGMAEPEAAHIFIPADRPWSRKLEVWLHEILHTMLYGVGITQEELVATILGEGLAAFLRDNRKDFEAVLKWIKKEDCNV